MNSGQSHATSPDSELEKRNNPNKTIEDVFAIARTDLTVNACLTAFQIKRYPTIQTIPETTPEIFEALIMAVCILAGEKQELHTYIEKVLLEQATPSFRLPLLCKFKEMNKTGSSE